MKNIYAIPAYLQELNDVLKKLDKNFLRGKKILISGATGMIASFLIDVLLSDVNFDITFFALTRSQMSFNKRFTAHLDDPRLIPIITDVQNPIKTEEKFDYVIHAASYTDPKNYASHPIDTMLINFIGTKNLLDVANNNQATFMLLSTCEIYGEGKGKAIKEDDYGYLDPTKVRNTYNESKRASETLAIAYSNEKNVKVLLPRFSRIFGPTMRLDDSKAVSQFLRNAINKQSIVLKSAGQQRYSYTYVADAVLALVYLLDHGESGVAYNVANLEQHSLKEIAELIANLAGVVVEVQQQDEYDGRGYSLATNAIQDITRIEKLGWQPVYTIKDGLNSTLMILKERI
ncbi:MAG: NAD-dependent epimerase/dehydratase family protein [Bacilli bacterium]